MIKIFSFLLIFLANLAGPAFCGDEARLTPDEYWQRIRAIAAAEFNGLELNPVLMTGYQFSGDNEGPQVGMQIELPLWNKKRKFEKREQAVAFLKKGAELVRELEAAQKTSRLLKEKSRFLLARMKDEGVDAVDSYFKSEQDIIKQDALITQYHRELHSLIEPLDKSVKIHSTKIRKVAADAKEN